MTEPSLADKVAHLRRPESYPGRPQRVEAIETHMSWVFLTDRHAYKLKKPIRYDRLDFSTPERRRFYCQEEVRLNRRLAASVYLGTPALTRDARGALTLGGTGRPVEWLVHMRRLPEHLTLEHLLSRRPVVGIRPSDEGEIRRRQGADAFQFHRAFIEHQQRAVGGEPDRIVAAVSPVRKGWRRD